MTRFNVLQIGLIAFFIGAIGYVSFLVFGFDSSKAGIASEALLVLIIMAWVGSYFSRVFSGKMTFMEQRKRYREAYDQKTNRLIQDKYDSMSEEDKNRLINELEIDKK